MRDKPLLSSYEETPRDDASEVFMQIFDKLANIFIRKTDTGALSLIVIPFISRARVIADNETEIAVRAFLIFWFKALLASLIITAVVFRPAMMAVLVGCYIWLFIRIDALLRRAATKASSGPYESLVDEHLHILIERHFSKGEEQSTQFKWIPGLNFHKQLRNHESESLIGDFLAVWYITLIGLTLAAIIFGLYPAVLLILECCGLWYFVWLWFLFRSEHEHRKIKNRALKLLGSGILLILIIVREAARLHQASLSKTRSVEEQQSENHDKQDEPFEDWGKEKPNERDLEVAQLSEQQLTVEKRYKHNGGLSVFVICREPLNIRSITLNRRFQFTPCLKENGSSGNYFDGFHNEEHEKWRCSHNSEPKSCNIGETFELYTWFVGGAIVEVTVNAVEGQGTWKWSG